MIYIVHRFWPSCVSGNSYGGCRKTTNNHSRVESTHEAKWTRWPFIISLSFKAEIQSCTTNLIAKVMWQPSIFRRLHDTSAVGYNIWRNSLTYISSALLHSNMFWTVWSAATQWELLKLIQMATNISVSRAFFLRCPEPSITKEHLNVWEMRDNRSWSVDIVNLHKIHEPTWPNSAGSLH